MAELPPLISGWTEHVGPQGQSYYYNAATGQSTYDRPSSIAPTVMKAAQSSQASNQESSSSSQNGHGNPAEAISNLPKAKKEKPAKKVPIPGASGWLKVTTTLGNIFYTHVESRRSEWTVPDEIKEYVDAMHDEDRRIQLLEEEERRLAKEQEEEERRLAKEEERLERQREEEKEIERRREELERKEQAVKKRREEKERIHQERMRILEEQGKRKRLGEEDFTQAKFAANGTPDKRAKIEDAIEENGAEDDLDWQIEMAAEMAAEADAADRGRTKPESPPPIAVSAPPAEAQISLDEQKELFMHMLTGLNGTSNEVNPMAPWDRELPKFVHERDYTVLKSVRDRQDAFNDWCKLRLREKRMAKIGQSGVTENKPGSRAVSNGISLQNSTSEEASKQYRSLLEAEVKSTRTKWEDFKKSWRKDRRFFSFGRDDRDREKVFRSWLKELGEVKRRAAEQADEDFIVLLQEHLGNDYRLEEDASTDEIQAAWSKVKKSPGLDRDIRYDAVGSSSRRAELFGEWSQGKRQPEQLNKGSSDVKTTDQLAIESTNGPGGADRALREREVAVENQRRKLEYQKQRAFGQASRDESVTTFQQLLIDAIRDPLISNSDAMRSISSDGRFEAPGIRPAEKERLVHEHIERLNDRRLRELQEVFEKHAPTLDVEAEVALPLIRDDDEIERRHLMEIKVIQARRKDLQDLFEDWNKNRSDIAHVAFQQMLKENAFVTFWGRLRQEHEQKITSESKNGTRQGEDEEDDDEPDLLEMAGKVDLEEIHSILRNDQRYRAFRHKPGKRDEWIRMHLQTMSVPKKTVYQKDV